MFGWDVESKIQLLQAILFKDGVTPPEWGPIKMAGRSRAGML